MDDPIDWLFDALGEMGRFLFWAVAIGFWLRSKLKGEDKAEAPEPAPPARRTPPPRRQVPSLGGRSYPMEDAANTQQVRQDGTVLDRLADQAGAELKDVFQQIKEGPSQETIDLLNQLAASLPDDDGTFEPTLAREPAPAHEPAWQRAHKRRVAQAEAEGEHLAHFAAAGRDITAAFDDDDLDEGDLVLSDQVTLYAELARERQTEAIAHTLADAEAVAAELIRPLRDHLVAHDRHFPASDPLAGLAGRMGKDHLHAVLAGGHPVLPVPGDLQRDLFRWGSLSHEIGHLALTQIPLLQVELLRLSGLADLHPTLLRVQNGRLASNLGQPVRAWLPELLADFFTVLQLGPAGLWSFVRIMAYPSDPAQLVRVRAAAGRYTPKPPTHLRFVVLADLLERMGFLKEAEAARTLWEEMHGELDHLVVPAQPAAIRLPLEAFSGPLHEIVWRLYGASLDALGGVQLQSVPGFEMSPGAWAKVRALSHRLAQGQAVRDDARRILAAALLARHEHPDAAGAIAQAFRASVLGDPLHDRRPVDQAYGDTPAARQAERPPRTAQPSSRRQALAEALVLREVLGPPVALRRRGPGRRRVGMAQLRRGASPPAHG